MRQVQGGGQSERSPGEWRNFYELQGRDAVKAGIRIDCSTAPVIDVVIRMTCDPRWTFQSLLDVGCGASVPYVAPLESLGKRVVGLDFARSFLSMAKSNGQGCSVQGDATALPFPDTSFDAVLCSETLEHIPDDRGAVKEIHRVLRPGGLLFLTVPNFWNASRILSGMRGNAGYRELQLGHLREYNRGMVDDLLGGSFRVLASYRAPFLWRGIVGGPLDALIRLGVLSRFSVSIAIVAASIRS